MVFLSCANFMIVMVHKRKAASNHEDIAALLTKIGQIDARAVYVLSREFTQMTIDARYV